MSKPAHGGKVIVKPLAVPLLDYVPARCIDLEVAFEMRRRRFTFAEIGGVFGVSKQAAAQMIRKYEHALLLEPLKDRKHHKRSKNV